MKDLVLGTNARVNSKILLATTIFAFLSVSAHALTDAGTDSASSSTDSVYSEVWGVSGPQQGGLPACAGDRGMLDVNNDQVIQWKTTTQNQFRARGHIQGHLTNIFPDATGHHHLEVTIGGNTSDTIEVVYNEDFGALPTLALNQVVEACGDYITSNARSGGYAPSPDGAILHWVHLSTNNHHPSGYIAIDGVAYGVGKQVHPPRRPKN